jgi:hypothetical protein
MPHRSTVIGVRTHEVTNQAPTLSGYNVVSSDPALSEGMERWANPADRNELEALGDLRAVSRRRCGATKADHLAPGAVCPGLVSEAFTASRLGGAHGHTFGTLPADLVEASAGKVIERSFPG